MASGNYLRQIRDAILTTLGGYVDGIEGKLDAIDSNTDRNTGLEIIEITLADDNWHDVVFAQAVKEFELQHQALTTDFQFRKDGDTEYITIGAGNTKHFPLALASATVGEIKRTGSASMVVAAIGYF